MRMKGEDKVPVRVKLKKPPEVRLQMEIIQRKSQEGVNL